jgi:hypothetical protein
MRGTYLRGSAWAEETEKLYRKTLAEDLLRVVAVAVVELFSAEVEGTGTIHGR